MSLLPAKFSVKCVHSRVGAGGGHEISPPNIQARKSGKGRGS